MRPAVTVARLPRRTWATGYRAPRSGWAGGPGHAAAYDERAPFHAMPGAFGLATCASMRTAWPSLLPVTCNLWRLGHDCNIVWRLSRHSIRARSRSTRRRESGRRRRPPLRCRRYAYVTDQATATVSRFSTNNCRAGATLAACPRHRSSWLDWLRSQPRPTPLRGRPTWQTRQQFSLRGRPLDLVGKTGPIPHLSA